MIGMNINLLGDMMKLNKVILLAGLFFSIILLSSCSRNEERTADVISVAHGNSQTALAGTECPRELMLLVQGPPRRGLLGVSKRRQAVGIAVKITPMTEGAAVLPDSGVTDLGGNFRCRLKLADAFGDQYFRVECPDFPEIEPLYVHAVSGVTVSGDSQETIAGRGLDKPIELLVSGADGLGMPDVPVFFSLKSGSKRAKLSAARAVTDKDGRVSVDIVTADDYTGKYEILAEVGEGSWQTRGIVIRALAISRVSLIIGLLGGLGIFIFGMTMMSDGLQQLAGDRLKALLQMFTSNRFKAMLAGLVVTSLIQSSGACTVMVMGFVNAALLSLNQAIGIILGAAIGTTVTAQMVSFRLDALALPAIAIGVLFMLLAKKNRQKGIATTILGFGLLFYGMMLMSSELKSIAEFPTFVSFFSKFDCTPKAGALGPNLMSVLGAIAVGTVMTVVVQSSSATVGVAIALADSGLLNFYTAFPLILGDNIGSTITGLVASFNTNRASRQTAMASTIFKVLGVIIMIPLLYVKVGGEPCFLKLTDIITSGDVFAPVPENIGRHLASAHTLFNIINVVIFLPLTNMVAVLARLVVPDRGASDEPRDSICHLEQRLLNTPPAALSQVYHALMAMIDVALDLTRKAVFSVTNTDKTIPEEEINHIEERIDNAQHSIIDYLVMLTRRNLNISQSASIPIFMHCVNDIERIGDRAVNIYDLLPTLKEKDIVFSEQAVSELNEIIDHLSKMECMLVEGMRNKDMAEIQKVVEMDVEVKRMTARFERSHEARLQALDCTVEKGVVFVELLSNLERISAHITNVAERANDILPHGVSFMTPKQK